MHRAAFLDHIGDPVAMRRQADALEAEAVAIWLRIKGAFFTASGKPKKPNPTLEQRVEHDRMDSLRREAVALVGRASRIERLQADPWSHIRPDILREFGLGDVAARVDAAHDEYIRAAEAA